MTFFPALVDLGCASARFQTGVSWPKSIILFNYQQQFNYVQCFNTNIQQISLSDVIMVSKVILNQFGSIDHRIKNYLALIEQQQHMSQGGFESQGQDFSSSFASSDAASKIELFTSQSKRLEKVYSKLSHHLIALRQRKIALLEKIDEAINLKSKFMAEIESLEKIQVKKMESKRIQKERLLIEQLKDREKAQQQLQESIQMFKKQHKTARMQAQYSKAVRLSQLIRSNLQLQSVLKTLLEKEAEKRYNEQAVLRNIQALMQQKNQLEAQIFELETKPKPSQKIQYYTLMPKEIQKECKGLNQQQQIIANQVFSHHQFDDFSTNDLIRLKADEQLQRELLFEQIQKLKSQLSVMKAQNQLMQQALANSKT